MLNKINICRICGYSDETFYPWGTDGKTPSFDICPCCNVEFGYEDSQKKGIIRYREKWIKSPKFNSNILKYKKLLANIPWEYI